MATVFAKEMIEHNLMNGATRLDLDYIANESCELAYKIHEKVKQYTGDKHLTEKDVKKIVSEHSVKPTAEPSQTHQY